MTNPLNPLNTADYKLISAEDQERRFESSVVDWTIKAFSMSAYRKQMSRPLNFESFSEVCNFPFKLCTYAMTDSTPIYRDNKSVHPLWFKAFRKIPVVQLFEQRLEEHLDSEDGRAFGMIFPRKGFVNGMIIHTGNWETYVGFSTGCHVYRGSESLGINYVVQPYQAFIRNIVAQSLWMPEE